jgi:CRP-like cAMP-binding protein
MDDAEIAKRLRAVPLFSSLPDADLRKIADRMKEVRFVPGTAVATQGQHGVGFHLVVEGTADVEKNGVKLGELGPGGYFGEIGLIDGGARSASVTATSDLSTLSLVGWDFKPLLDNLEVAKGLLLGLCAIARQERGEPPAEPAAES